MKKNFFENNIFVSFAYVSGEDVNFDYDKYFFELPEYRLEKINNFKFQKDKLLSAGAWILLKHSLKKFDVNIDDYAVEFEKYDKPYLKKCPLKFNLSHSGRVVMCAISNNSIGCDVEIINDYDHKLTNYCMNTDEINNLVIDDNLAVKSMNFYTLWTIKESIMKCLGSGLTIDPKDITIKKIDDKYDFILKNQNMWNPKNKIMSLYNFQIDKNYCFSVCDYDENKECVTKQFVL